MMRKFLQLVSARRSPFAGDPSRIAPIAFDEP